MLFDVEIISSENSIYKKKPIQEVSVAGSRPPLAGQQLLVEPGAKKGRDGQGERHSLTSGSTFAVQVQDTRNSTR